MERLHGRPTNDASREYGAIEAFEVMHVQFAQCHETFKSNLKLRQIKLPLSKRQKSPKKDRKSGTCKRGRQKGIFSDLF